MYSYKNNIKIFQPRWYAVSWEINVENWHLSTKIDNNDWQSLYKVSLLYHGGTLFGTSVNHPERMAITMLAWIVKFLYSAPELIAKTLPLCGLDVNFQLSQCQPIIDKETAIRWSTDDNGGW